MVGTLPHIGEAGPAPSSPGDLAPAIAFAGMICLGGAVAYFALPSRRSPI
jgi:hypothetical protein